LDSADTSVERSFLKQHKWHSEEIAVSDLMCDRAWMFAFRREQSNDLASRAEISSMWSECWRSHTFWYTKSGSAK